MRTLDCLHSVRIFSTNRGIADRNATLLANLLPGESITEAIRRMEAKNAQPAVDNERRAPGVEYFNFWGRYRPYSTVPDPPDMTVY